MRAHYTDDLLLDVSFRSEKLIPSIKSISPSHGQNMTNLDSKHSLIKHLENIHEKSAFKIEASTTKLAPLIKPVYSKSSSMTDFHAITRTLNLGDSIKKPLN